MWWPWKCVVVVRYETAILDFGGGYFGDVGRGVSWGGDGGGGRAGGELARWGGGRRSRRAMS